MQRADIVTWDELEERHLVRLGSYWGHPDYPIDFYCTAPFELSYGRTSSLAKLGIRCRDSEAFHLSFVAVELR